jgi:hypothetical protein
MAFACALLWRFQKLTTMAFLSVSRNSVARRRKAWRWNLDVIPSMAVLVRLDD